MTAPATGGPPDARSMNRQMVDRLLAAPASALPRNGYALRVLETTGRVSGEARRTPVGLLDRDGRDYLVCPDRTRDWPANLASTPAAVLLAGDERQDVVATEVTGSDAAATVAAYLSVVTVPWAVAAFRLEPGASLADIESQVGRMAVFVLSRRP